MWILTVLLGLIVAMVGIVVSFGFMSGRELYEHGIIYEMEKDSSSSSIKHNRIKRTPSPHQKTTWIYVSLKKKKKKGDLASKQILRKKWRKDLKKN